MEHQGTDRLGRDVYLVLAGELGALRGMQLPNPPFILLIGADHGSIPADQYFAVASHVLSSGATRVLCWGRECAAAENVFDEAIVGSAGEFPYGEVVTTSHEGESLCDVLGFATSGTVSPDLDGATLVVVMVGAGWYGEAHNCLEDLLESKPE